MIATIGKKEVAAGAPKWVLVSESFDGEKQLSLGFSGGLTITLDERDQAQLLHKIVGALCCPSSAQARPDVAETWRCPASRWRREETRGADQDG